MVDLPDDPADGERPGAPAAAARTTFSSEPPSGIAVASARVARIVEAAEIAAEELRRGAEARARERIAEADRAADLRVAAAEAEAGELLEQTRLEVAAAQAEARAAVAAIHDRAAELRAEAERHRTESAVQAHADATAMIGNADAQAKKVTGAARVEAREVLGDAHRAAREVVREGEQLTQNLRDLAQSLVRNADTLMRDVKQVHGKLAAQLDEATPPQAVAPRVPSAVRGAPGAATTLGPETARSAAAPPRRAGRTGRGASAPLPVEIAQLLDADDTPYDVPEFVKPPRRGR